MRIPIGALIAFGLVFVMVGGAARADSITVANGNFGDSNALTIGCGTGCAYNYSGVPYWSTSGPVGSFLPGGYFSSVPSGTTVAFANAGGSLSQDLGVTLAPDTTYTLNVLIGDRPDAPGSFTIALDAGSITECTFSGSSSSIAPGTFGDETCSFTTDSTPPSGDLTVLLFANSTQVDFGEVSVATPEPSSILLSGAGLLLLAIIGVFYKRKQSLPGMAA